MLTIVLGARGAPKETGFGGRIGRARGVRRVLGRIPAGARAVARAETIAHAMDAREGRGVKVMNGLSLG